MNGPPQHSRMWSLVFKVMGTWDGGNPPLGMLYTMKSFFLQNCVELFFCNLFVLHTYVMVFPFLKYFLCHIYTSNCLLPMFVCFSPHLKIGYRGKNLKVTRVFIQCGYLLYEPLKRTQKCLVSR